MAGRRISTCARPGMSEGPSGRSTPSEIARGMRYKGVSGVSSKSDNDPSGGKTMTGFRRTLFLLVIAATLALAPAARAEGIFKVNNDGTGSWVFDPPSVVATGSI